MTAAPAVRAEKQLLVGLAQGAGAPAADAQLTTERTARSRGRDPYYHSVFEAFLSYIADGEPFSVRTTSLNGTTDVTLRFKSETFTAYMAHLDAFPEAP